MKSNKLISIDPNSVNVRLGLCAAALVGTAAAIPQDVDATVVTFNPSASIPNTFAGIYVNFVTGQIGSPAAAVPGFDFNPYSSGGTLSIYWGPAANGAGGVTTAIGSNIYADLAAGATVSSASPFSNLASGTNPNYLTAGTHILGFRFLNDATGIINYGYATLQTGGGTGFPATLISWSFENNGGAITVVPEPSTVALLTISALALGALGLREWRRQRAA